MLSHVNRLSPIHGCRKVIHATYPGVNCHNKAYVPLIMAGTLLAHVLNGLELFK